MPATSSAATTPPSFLGKRTFWRQESGGQSSSSSSYHLDQGGMTLTKGFKAARLQPQDYHHEHQQQSTHMLMSTSPSTPRTSSSTGRAPALLPSLSFLRLCVRLAVYSCMYRQIPQHSTVAAGSPGCAPMATETPPPTVAGQLRRQTTAWMCFGSGSSPAERLLGGSKGAAAALGANTMKRGILQDRRELPTNCVCSITPTALKLGRLVR